MYLIQLHWLPVEQRIIYTLIVMTFKALYGLAPQYNTDLISHYVQIMISHYYSYYYSYDQSLFLEIKILNILDLLKLTYSRNLQGATRGGIGGGGGVASPALFPKTISLPSFLRICFIFI